MDDELRRRLDALSPEQRALLEKKLSMRPTEQTVSRTIAARREPGCVVPASSVQARLLFLERLAPQAGLYNAPVAIRLEGSLEPTILRRALTRLVQRHEILRTTFTIQDGAARQVIRDASFPILEELERREFAEGIDDEGVRAWAIAESRRPFDLERGPLFCAQLLRQNERRWFLLFVFHHLITDGWSTGLLLQEVFATYEALQGEREPDLDALPLQYGSYALSQQESLSSTSLRSRLDSYVGSLSGLEIPELLSDFPRPDVPTFLGERTSVHLDGDLLDQIRAVASQNGVTLFTTMLAVFKVLLSRCSRSSDIVVGTGMANRMTPETQSILGPFVNTIVLRTNLGGDPTFKELLSRVDAVVREGQANQDLPFESVVERLTTSRDIRRHPLFQVLFMLQNVPLSPPRVTGLQLDLLRIPFALAKFDLTVALTEHPTRLTITFEYAADLFSATTVATLLDTYQRWVCSFARSPNQSISTPPFPVGVGSENGISVLESPSPDVPCLHEAFEVQVARRPDAPAARCEGECLTYRQLDRRANRLANRLQRLGIGPDVRVGLCLERTLDVPVGILAILKAGGAYVPLDPEYPASRLKYLIEDSMCHLVVAHECVCDHLPDLQIPLVLVDSDDLATESDGRPATSVKPENLAYVIYTSGSTGKPKGTLVPHAGVRNVVAASIERFRIRSDSRVLQFASLSFDASVWQLFVALHAGACSIIASQRVRKSIQALHDVIAEERVSYADLPPAVLRLLKSDDLEAFHDVSTGGEPCTPEAIATWSGGRRFWNVYGPTETSVATSWARFLPEDTQRSYLSIGRSVPGTRLLILDESMRPLPKGVPGELTIGGVGVTRGYFDASETAARFVPDPFGRRPGQRLYRTGDLARMVANGEVEFLGRRDDQLKLRGFRIEPGEIRSALLEHPDVRDTEILAREIRAGDRQLLAYVVADRSLSTLTLRRFLKGRLPDFMVPSHFVFMESFPRIQGDKVDRRALPIPEFFRPDGDSYVAPETPTEHAIATLWMTELHLDRVGRHDNFFDLGGHSLQALIVLDGLERTLKVRVHPRDLLLQTLAQLAATCDGLGDG